MNALLEKSFRSQCDCVLSVLFLDFFVARKWKTVAGRKVVRHARCVRANFTMPCFSLYSLGHVDSVQRVIGPAACEKKLFEIESRHFLAIHHGPCTRDSRSRRQGQRVVRATLRCSTCNPPHATSEQYNVFSLRLSPECASSFLITIGRLPLTAVFEPFPTIVYQVSI